MTENDTNQLNREIFQCFDDQRCQSGFDASIRDTRPQCYRRIRQEVKQELQNCVRQRIGLVNVEIPDRASDPDSLNQYRRYLRRLTNDFCPPQNRAEVNFCLDRKFRDVGPNPERKNGDQCRNKKEQCGRLTIPECYQLWNERIKPHLRQCINQWDGIRREDTRARYTNCVNQATQGRYNKAYNDDYYYNFFSQSIFQKRFVDRQEPCPGQLT